MALIGPPCPRIFFFLMEALTTSSEALRASAGINVTEIYEGDIFIDKPTRGRLLNTFQYHDKLLSVKTNGYFNHLHEKYCYCKKKIKYFEVRIQIICFCHNLDVIKLIFNKVNALINQIIKLIKNLNIKLINNENCKRDSRKNWI